MNSNSVFFLYVLLLSARIIAQAQVIDQRCRLLQPLLFFNFGENAPCSRCPLDGCPANQICCPSGCAGGTTCRQAPSMNIDQRCRFLIPLPAFPPREGVSCSMCPASGCPEGQICCASGCPGGTTCRQIPSFQCPSGEEVSNCFHRPCATATCARFPNAECSNNFCGGCNAVFTNATTREVIPKFACDFRSQWPDCLASITCPVPAVLCSTGCPRFPNSACIRNCDCSNIFTDRTTGKTLSAIDCGREFDSRCRRAPPRTSNQVCSVCNKRCQTGQICCPVGCTGGQTGSACIPIPRIRCNDLSDSNFNLDCTNGDNAGSICRLSCPAEQFLIGEKRIRCQSSGRWSPSVRETRCMNGSDFDSRCPLVLPMFSANCPICPLRCPLGEICCPNGCPGSSNCMPIPSCPPTLELESCDFLPCDVYTCPRFPDAVCRNDFCGGCKAIFLNTTTTEVVPRLACGSNSRWPECLQNIRCSRPEIPCETGCPRVPDAACTLNCDCSNVFIDRRTGYTLSAIDCGREFDSRCPAEPLPTNKQFCLKCPRKCPENEICCRTACTNGRIGSTCVPIATGFCPDLNSFDFIPICNNANNVESICQLRCPLDKVLNGSGRITCQTNGQWFPSVNETRCANIIPVTCPDLSSFSFISDCSNNNNTGSVCQLRCPSFQFLKGVSRIECQDNGEWTPEFEGTRCINFNGFDRRCPAVLQFRPTNCPVCPVECEENEICCLNACPGSSNCIPIPGCPPDLPEANCFASPCSTATCPRYPDARCEDDFCGGCHAVFVNTTTNEVIPNFSCQATSQWPECLQTIRCANPEISCETGCPRVPEAICRLNCNCARIFIDKRTGKNLSALECGREFVPQCPSRDMSANTQQCLQCPRECPPDQICCRSRCSEGRNGSSCISIPRVTCRRLLDFDYHINCTDVNNLGSVCLLRCNSNKELLGSPWTRCLDSGDWFPPPERTSCRKRTVTCPSLRNFGFLSACTNENDEGSTCRLRCLMNQELIGSRRVTCQINGRWAPSLESIRCRNRTICSNLRDFNFMFTCSESNNEGSTCQLTCPSHQVLVGNKVIRCQNNGQWSTSVETIRCTNKTVCPILLEYNFLFSCSDGNNAESFCQLFCPSHQQLVGNSVIRCLTSGQWSPPPKPTQCRNRTVTCPSLTGYDFLFSCSNNNNEGSVCELRCFSKQNLIGNRIIRCENNGEWSPSFEETTCRNRITCTSLQRHSFRSTCSDSNYEGSHCQLTCSSHQELIGNPTVRCQNNGQWYPSVNRVQCRNRIVNCTSMPSSSRTYVSTCSNGNNLGSVCQIRCRSSRQTVVGDRLLRCQSNGTWSSSPDRIRCVTVTCPHLRVYTGNFLYACSNGNRIGSMCRLSCRDGDRLNGQRETVCQSNGRWSRSVTSTRCRTVLCPRLNLSSVITNCSNTYFGGSECHFRCPRNQYLIGRRSIRCHTSGRWYPSFTGTRCRKIIKVVTCPSIDSSKYITTCRNGFRAGSQCRLTCPPGKRISRLTSSTCTSYGHWYPAISSLPTCQSVTPAPPSCSRIQIPNMVYNCVSSGYSCELSCRAGYQLIGVRVTFCLRNARTYYPSPLWNQCRTERQSREGEEEEWTDEDGEEWIDGEGEEWTDEEGEEWNNEHDEFDYDE